MASFEGTIDERFEWIQMILQPFKQAITGSKFEFLGVLSKNKSFFKYSSTLLDHIDKLLQIFSRCRAYKFYIGSYINENTPAHVLASILQFEAIVRCSKITLNLILGVLRQGICPSKPLETGSIALMPMVKMNAF